MTAVFVARQGSRTGMSLDELLVSSDVISIHAPVTPRDAAPDRSQGARADEAVRVPREHGARHRSSTKRRWSGRSSEHLIAGAALDVFEREPEVHPGLLALENVVLAPHLGSATRETRTAMADLAVRNVARRARRATRRSRRYERCGAQPERPARPRSPAVMRRLAKAIDGLEEPAVEKIAKDQQEDPFQVLIATMLSAQTQGRRHARGLDAAVPRRAHAAHDGEADAAQIERLIYPVSFYRNKAVHVQRDVRAAPDALRRPRARRRWRSC